MISNRIDTEKALQAQELEIPVVKPEWIYECFKNWKRVDWSIYKLEIVGKRRRNENKRSFDEIEDFIDKDNGDNDDNDDNGDNHCDDDIFEDGDFNDFDDAEFIFENSSKITLNFDAADLEDIQKELEDLEDEESENDHVSDSENASVSVDEIYSELDKELDITSIHSTDNELLTTDFESGSDPDSKNRI